MKKWKTVLLTVVAGSILLAGVFVFHGNSQPALDPELRGKVANVAPDELQKIVAAEAEKLGVTALSITLIEGTAPAQSHYIGRAQAGGLMQAASLSKAVAAAVILIIADKEGVGIDDDIRPQVTSLDFASLEGGDRPITLRQLLSHTTGASQSGYPGYPRGDELPSTAEVIGAPPRFFESRLTFDGTPGEFRYSGGGYTIAQLWAEDMTGEDFAALAERHLLEPLGMEQSTFAQPIDPSAIAPLKIVGADSEFDPMSGVFSSLDDSWHNYPEQAAAGLWTTSHDYARFAAALVDAASGVENAISQKIAHEMISPQVETGWETGSHYGLGIMVKLDEDGAVTDVSHTGANAGYRALFIAKPASAETQRRVVAIMANTASSPQLNREIGEALVER